jgi:undecaprenyl-diphosphatase
MTGLTYAHAVLLGALQGLTEFLPVSSSGHLLLARELLGVTLPGLSFEIMLHAGTAAAVVVVLRREIISMLKALFTWDRAAPSFVLGWRIVLASVPAVVAASLLGSFIEERLNKPSFAAAMLLVTAAILLLGPRGLRPSASRQVRRRRPDPANPARSRYPLRSDVPSPAAALWIGLAQAVAILPGVSRSASTVVAGLRCGLPRDAASRFSLLLSLPVIFGGALVDLLARAAAGETALPLGPALAGVGTAFVCGLLAANLLLLVVRKARLGWFGVYCALAGLAGLWLTR